MAALRPDQQDGTDAAGMNISRSSADVEQRGVPLINPISYAPQLPEVSTPSPRPAQAPIAPVRGDTVNFSAQALATAVVDAQVSGAIVMPPV